MATFHRPFKGNRSSGKRFFKKREPDHKINDKITASEVRLVGDNIEVGVYPISKAINMAEELELDLVELVPGADPPVCKIIDYQKFLYEKRKKEKEQKANAHKTVIKEIRFGPSTDEHDFLFKLNHAKKFLKEGSKVKAYVHFKGRTIAYKEKGEIILLRLASELEEIGKVEQMPKLEGNRMFIHLAPLSIKKIKKS